MKSILRILVGVIFIILFTRISFDLNLNELEIPITGQTFAVLLVGYVLGLKEGFIATLLYVTLGVLGLPVFADGASGVETISGNSGGYIIGFVMGATVCGFVSDRFNNSFLNAFFATFLGTLIILIMGVSRLSYTFGFFKALEYGFYPFWLGALVKIILGSVAGYFLKEWYSQTYSS